MAGRNGGFVGLFLVVVGVLMASMESARAYKFYAGGRDGWVLHPSESYLDWSSRNRFEVNDTIFFRYDKGQDSVLVVSEQQFVACDTSNPIARLDGGDSLFKFDRSGPFFFISGVPANCQRGQKLLVVVMAVSRRQWAQPPISHPPSLPSTPAPVSSAPSPDGASPPTNRTPSPSPSPKPSAGAPTQGPLPGGGAISPAQAPSESAAALNGLQSTTALTLMMILVAAILG